MVVKNSPHNYYAVINTFKKIITANHYFLPFVSIKIYYLIFILYDSIYNIIWFPTSGVLTGEEICGLSLSQFSLTDYVEYWILVLFMFRSILSFRHFFKIIDYIAMNILIIWTAPIFKIVVVDKIHLYIYTYLS